MYSSAIEGNANMNREIALKLVALGWIATSVYLTLVAMVAEEGGALAVSKSRIARRYCTATGIRVAKLTRVSEALVELEKAGLITIGNRDGWDIRIDIAGVVQ